DVLVHDSVATAAREDEPKLALRGMIKSYAGVAGLEQRAAIAAERHARNIPSGKDAQLGPAVLRGQHSAIVIREIRDREYVGWKTDGETKAIIAVDGPVCSSAGDLRCIRHRNRCSGTPQWSAAGQSRSLCPSEHEKGETGRQDARCRCGHAKLPKPSPL